MADIGKRPIIMAGEVVIRTGTAMMCGLLGLAFVVGVIQLYMFVTTNGVNWDCPNKEAHDAMTRFEPRAASATMCFSACQQAADADNRDIDCRCPTSDGRLCEEMMVGPTIVHHTEAIWRSR